jgi:AraC-like DNA-binding protein
VRASQAETVHGTSRESTGVIPLYPEDPLINLKSMWREPRPALVPFVSSIGYAESAFTHGRELSLPSGTMHLYVNLDRDEMRVYPLDGGPAEVCSGIAVRGPSSKPVFVDPADQRRVVWASFRVGGAYPFVPADAAALRDTLVDLADLWGRDGPVLRERLLSASTPAQRLNELEAALLARARRPLERDGAVVAAAVALHRGATVGAAADRLGWTPRRLGREFATHIGLAPKRFARVRRFQRLVRAAASDAAGPAELTYPAKPDWARLAVETGYHDQAHLIHDFRDLAGLTPGAYRPRSPGEHNHVPVSTIAPGAGPE